MSAGPLPLFRSSGQRGYSSLDQRAIRAASSRASSSVKSTCGSRPSHARCRPPKGVVHARPGDAIVTGTAGEHWRVSRARFADKYRPVPPTVAGEAGRYVSLPNRIMAVPMSESLRSAAGRRRFAPDAGAPASGWSTMATAASESSPRPSSPPPTKSSTDRSMALHQVIQRLLLIGAHVDSLPPPARAAAAAGAVAAHRGHRADRTGDSTSAPSITDTATAAASGPFIS